jgi:hypothetical protein
VTSFGIHYLLALACFLASLRPSMLAVVVRVSVWTKVSISSFFVLTGVTQLLVAVDGAGGASTAHLVIDAVRVVCVAGILTFMFLDQARVVRRMANALGAIRDEYDGLALVRGKKGRDMIERGTAEQLPVGRRVAATISFALLGRDEEPRHPDVLQ